MWAVSPLKALLRGLETIGRVGLGEGTGRSACCTMLELAPVQVRVTRLREPAQSYVSPTRRVLPLQALESQTVPWTGV